MKRTASIIVTLLLLVGARASAITIDFEAYADRQNLNNVNLGGVTLTAPNGSVEVFANNRGSVFYHSPVKAVGNFFPVSGFVQDNPLTGVFDSPTSFVSLWAGDGGGDQDKWRLDVYDAVSGGILLGSVTSADWNGSPYSNLTLSASGIMRFEAYEVGTTTAGIGFDDLSFDSARVPDAGSTLFLAALSLFGLAGLRKRLA